MSHGNFDDDSEWDMMLDGPFRSGKLRNLAHRTKTKTKKVLNLDQGAENHGSPESTPIEVARNELKNNPAFNPSRFLHETQPSEVGIVGKTKDILQSTTQAILHPKKSAQSRVTKTAAGKLARGRPGASKKVDLDFLDAHDDLQAAESSACISDDEAAVTRKWNKVDDCNDEVNKVEDKRMSMRVAWMTDRQIRRVKVLKGEPGRFPDNSFFEEKDNLGKTKFLWGRWIAYVLLYYSHSFTVRYIDDFDEPRFDLDSLRRDVERLIIVSAPLQTFCSEVRRLYRWEDMALTGKWMVVYFVLMYYSQVMTFAYLFILYYVVKNYYYPNSLESLRDSMARSIDRGSTAFKVAEMMDKHGNDDWLEPLVDELGPWIQIQLNDLINMLEVIDNFYHWRSPSKTRATLLLFSVCGLISAVASSNFCLKIVYFVSGVTFFICWPISSHFPKYRLLVSPLKWLFWDIPTHAEWSIKYLQKQSNIVGQALDTGTYSGIANSRLSLDGADDSDADSFTSANTTLSTSSTDILAFHCTYSHTPGHFIISSTGIRFRPSLRNPLSSKTASFEYLWIQIDEMNKAHRKKTFVSKATKLTAGLQRLEIRVKDVDGGEISNGNSNAEERGTDGTGGERRGSLVGERSRSKSIMLENMKGRDRAFNAILGFSGLKWQCLQGG